MSPENGMNIYRGCTHGCIYCDSRSKCYQMHHDFEDIEVKQNAPELLEQKLRSKRNKCMIGTGAMCDPYMHCEEQLQLTRKCLELIRQYEFGVTIQTKSDRILRDIQLISEINRTAKAVVQMTLTTYDDELCRILEPKGNHSCSFERIYFSRGSDRDIYLERKALGEQLVPEITRAIGGDTDNTVFSFIPNTAEVAYYGMLQGFKKQSNEKKAELLYTMMQDHRLTKEEISQVLHNIVRGEKVAIKDIKLRTFIAEGNTKKELAAHVYDITYGSLRAGEDNLVIIDDSIVRGTTLKESILRILDRLHPKKIVLVSSCPQVRYPDYYGIDMASMEEFIAFRAAIALLHERGMEDVVDRVYRACLAQRQVAPQERTNPVKGIYAPFSDAEISEKMVRMLKPEGMTTPVEIVFQTLDGLHKACPNSPGDWYFSGDYPTPGGCRQVCEAFIRYCEQSYSE